MATPRQTEADRRNASTRTGPAAEEGKARARANALEHGPAGAGDVLTDDQAEAVAARRAGWTAAFEPRDEAETWLVEQLVIESLRIDAAQAEAFAQSAHDARRAGLCWDDDRATEAAELGRRISRQPARVARKLARSRHGCDWLLARWAELAGSPGQGGDWSDEERSLAFDLLGVEPADRDGHDPWTPADGGPAGLVARETARLTNLRDTVWIPLDADERRAAASGVPVTAGPDGATVASRARDRIRRYEAACWRRFHAAMSQLEATRAGRSVAVPKPATEPDVAPPPQPVAVAAPPAPVDDVRPEFLARLREKWVDSLLDDEPDPAADRPRLTEVRQATTTPLALSRPPHSNRRSRRAAERRARSGRAF